MVIEVIPFRGGAMIANHIFAIRNSR